MRLSLITRSWRDHGPHSGFERLADYLPPGQCHRVPPLPLWSGLARRLARATRKVNYSSDAVRRELGALAWCARHRSGLLHCLYGDQDFHYLAYAKWVAPRTRLLATFHHPPAELARRWKRCGTRSLRALDGVTCVGRNQLGYLQSLLPATRVWWLPHGIDTNFFRPDPACPRRPRRLWVTGISHRDFATLRAALEILGARDPGVEVIVNVPPEFRSQFPSLPSLHPTATRLSDEELLAEYRMATCTLLCLEDCTASNTLLEALATGCPLVVTDVGGVRDYVSDGEACLVPPRDPVALAGATLRLLADPIRQRSLSERGRLQAERYAWPRIAAQAMAIYEVAAGILPAVEPGFPTRRHPSPATPESHTEDDR